jgi:parallel beta-helix repeat protein
MGIFLSNVTGTTVMGNVIISNREELPGIFAESMSGGIRTNIIEGHTNGIHLGNSSPDIGGNTITANKYHGIYIGTGSYPNMEGYIAGSPPVFYPVSGYNKIFENGGWEEENGPYDNDGSEIYFNNSNAVLSRGCNQIYDDRAESSPLINTWILMSGESIGFPASINAEYNFWEIPFTHQDSQV